MLISIEGLDGVGKTTISNAIMKSLNISLVEKPIRNLLDIDDNQSKKITQIYMENILLIFKQCIT